jgi:cholesterol oxidase
VEQYEAVVIGSGFGGAINACRLSKKWPGQVLVLERGKRYPKGSFPRSPHDMARNFWNVQSEERATQGMKSSEDTRGMFDVRCFDHLDVVICAGLGGGSLIYASAPRAP